MNDEKLRIIGGLIIAVILIYPVFAFGMTLMNNSKEGKSGEESAKSSSGFQETVLNRLPNTYADLGEIANKENGNMQKQEQAQDAGGQQQSSWQPASSPANDTGNMPVRRIPAAFGFAPGALPNLQPELETDNSPAAKGTTSKASPIRYNVNITVSEENPQSDVRTKKKGGSAQESSVIYRRE